MHPHSFVAVAILLVVAVQTASASIAFDAYRMVQYEDSRGAEKSVLGSQRASVNLLAASASSTGDLARKMAVTRIGDVTVDFLSNLVQRKIGGLLVFLPSNMDELSGEWLATWREHERLLLKERYEIPIYFAFEDENSTSLYESLAKPVGEDADEKIFQLVASTSEGALLSDSHVTNIQGWLGGIGNVNEGGTLPTIAIVASYDTLSVAPELAFGMDSSATGVVALLETARLFSKLYRANGSRTQGGYNLLFALVGGGRLNYAGTKNFLAATDTRVLDTIEFTLCLDALGGSSMEDPLYLHVSKIPREGPVNMLYDEFTATAKEMGIPLEFSRRKINISSPDMQWHHERFSRKRISAATLSRHSEPAPWLERPELFDTRHNVKQEVLMRNIKFVAEVLAKHVYNLHGSDVEVFDGLFGLDEKHVETWMEYLSTVPRMLLPKDAPLFDGFEKSLNLYTNEATRHSYKLDGGVMWYSSGRAAMSAFLVKSMYFDFVFLAANLAYLAALLFFLQGLSGFTALLKALGLKSKSSRKNS